MTMTIIAPIEPAGYSSYTCKLPFDLERGICEIAVSNFPQCLPNVVLVCHRFRIWFEPELYRIIRYVEGKELPFYLPDSSGNKVLDMPRIRAFGQHVQHVLLFWDGTPERIYDILKCCPNIFDLALRSARSPGSCAHLVPFLEKLPLRNLHFDPTAFFPDLNSSLVDASNLPQRHTIFRHLTHLKMGVNGTSWWTHWKRLVHLPKLTHLALTGIDKEEAVEHALEEWRHLELLVLTIVEFGRPGDPIMEFVQSLDKDRVVIIHLPFPRVLQTLDEWEIGARGGDGWWTTAQRQKEAAMEDRRRSRTLGHSGEADNIEPDVICLIHLLQF